MQKRVPLVQWTFLLFFTGYRAPSLPGIYTDSTPLSSFTERKRESGTGWDGVNGRILRCKFHSTRPLFPFLSIFRSLFHSCRSPFSLCPTVRPTFLYLVSLFHLSLSFYFLLLVFFIYDRPPLSLKSSRRSPLFFFLFLFSNFVPSPSLFPMSPSIRWSYHDRLARTDTLFRGSSRFLRSKRERESSWQSAGEDLSRMRRPS